MDETYARFRDRVGPSLRSGTFENLEASLTLVQADLDATWPEIGQLSFKPVADREMVVMLRDGDYHVSDGTIDIDEDDDDVASTVAFHTQQCLMLCRFTMWPKCRLHDRMLEFGDSTWVCSDGGGHEVARIGELGAVS